MAEFLVGSLSAGAVGQVDDSALNKLGTRRRSNEGNEFIYLEGVANVVAGDFVTYDAAYKAARTTATTYGPVAVASAAIVASKFGWFQVGGLVASANVATHSAGVATLCLSATAGRATTTAAAGKTIFGATSAGNSASNVGPVFLNGSPMAHGTATL